MSFDDRLADYVDVAARIAELREKHPDASLQSNYKVVEVAGATFIVCRAECYRTPGDERPGVGLAWEPFPGKTPYTKDSELQNAETSAWGRAIVAALAADTKRGIASADEVRNRQEVATAGRAQGSGSSGQASPAPAGHDQDPWLDLLHNPGGWFNNLADKAEGKGSPKAPDFKAKKTNPHWGQAGEYRGNPAPLALWLSDAPPGWHEAFESGDVSLLAPKDESVSRGATVADALGGQIVDPDEAPFF